MGWKTTAGTVIVSIGLIWAVGCSAGSSDTSSPAVGSSTAVVPVPLGTVRFTLPTLGGPSTAPTTLPTTAPTTAPVQFVAIQDVPAAVLTTVNRTVYKAKINKVQRRDYPTMTIYFVHVETSRDLWLLKIASDGKLLIKTLDDDAAAEKEMDG